MAEVILDDVIFTFLSYHRTQGSAAALNAVSAAGLVLFPVEISRRNSTFYYTQLYRVPQQATVARRRQHTAHRVNYHYVIRVQSMKKAARCAELLPGDGAETLSLPLTSSID